MSVLSEQQIEYVTRLETAVASELEIVTRLEAYMTRRERAIEREAQLLVWKNGYANDTPLGLVAVPQAQVPETPTRPQYSQSFGLPTPENTAYMQRLPAQTGHHRVPMDVDSAQQRINIQAPLQQRGPPPSWVFP
ncbi:hypothetical protein VNI00_010894 [Paramarasmius palmivorus]|uniref:Uncharacterized protein n=1 Tax=Paramarasmius palmivorus TaxID=297713 RepID=A0AAW0CF04_9AGAR